jgi:hypothetical protein
MRPFLACLIGLALTTPVSAPVSAAISVNPFNDQMLKLSPADRNGALRRGITTSEARCGRLEKSVYRGMYGNLGMYAARCKPGGDYAVFTGPDGTVQVRPCGDLKGLKLPECKLD